MKDLPLLALLCLVSVTARATADVRVVSPAPSAPYHEIQAAVDAANDGDVILVKQGTYSSFAVRNQELVITADSGASPIIVGGIRVGGVGATRSLVLAGLHATGMAATSFTRHGLYAHDTDGALRVFGCELAGLTQIPSGGSPNCAEGQGAWFERCADVLLVGCDLRGSGTTTPMFQYSDAGHGGFARSSVLTIYDSTLRGGRGSQYVNGYSLSCDPPPSAMYPQQGDASASGEGLRTISSRVIASGTVFTGGNGADGACDSGLCVCAGPGANGIAITSTATPAALYGCAMNAGARGFQPATCAGITIHNCANDCAGWVPGESVVGPTLQLPETPRRVRTTHVVREGGNVTFQFDGVAGDVISMEMTDDTGYESRPAEHGVRITRQPRPRLSMQVGTLTGAQLSTTWTVPDLGPGVQAHVLFVQATFVDPSGQRRLSSPDVIVLLDASF